MNSVLRYWQTRTHCCGQIVAHDVSWATQTGKHFLRTQNVSEQNQKQFLCAGDKICVRNKCCARGQTGKHLCRNNVSSFARAFSRVKSELVCSQPSVSHVSPKYEQYLDQTRLICRGSEPKKYNLDVNYINTPISKY